MVMFHGFLYVYQREIHEEWDDPPSSHHIPHVKNRPKKHLEPICQWLLMMIDAYFSWFQMNMYISIQLYT